ncbi:MAG: hypothetical protein JSV62_07765 [Promethearchaeota archaeon]|nr:MAG: hypothetical protein JSV62_07765 [Candidatus Lokiarchaeota archaeon]
MRFVLNHKRGIFLLFLLLTIIFGITAVQNTNQNYLLDENTLSISAPDDPYYPNNSSSTAFDLSGYKNTWLSSIYGVGIQLDIDWYNITIMTGEERLIVKLLFWHFDDNLDLIVLDWTLNPIVDSTTFTDNEYIDYILPSPGMYYIVVYGNNLGNKYDLLWSSIDPFVSDDVYDFNDLNDIRDNATNIFFLNNTWLSSFNGLGIQADDDWYEIFIPTGMGHLIVELIFCHAFGDIDIEIWDDFYNIIASNTDVIDNAFIELYNLPGGIYYIHIYYHNAGNTYDLRWTALPSGYDDWMEPNNDFYSAYPVTPNYYGGLMITDYDEDWCRIYLEPGDKIEVYIYFDHYIGDLELELYDPSYGWRAGSYSTNHDETIVFSADVAGNWRIKIYRVAGNSFDDVYYDLDIWVFKEDPTKEDPYEWNDNPENAYPLVEYEHTWLSEIHGNARQGSEDWYGIFVTPGFQDLVIYVIFNNSYGNIDITLHQVWDRHNLNTIAGNYSFDDNEYLTLYDIAPGPYLIQIHGAFMGNEYDLWWDDLRTDFRPDDNYEDNDTPLDAYDLSHEIQHEDEYGIRGKSLGQINNIGIQADSDWYKISIGSEFLQLRVVVLYEYSAGAIGIEIYDWDLHRLIDNFTASDNEYINYKLPSNGTYYIRIFGSNEGSPYELFWELQELSKGMIPGYDIYILLGVIFGVATVIGLKWKRSKRNL